MNIHDPQAVDIKQSGFHPVDPRAFSVSDIDELLRLNLSIQRELRIESNLLENRKLIDRLLDIRSQLTATQFQPAPSKLVYTQ